MQTLLENPEDIADSNDFTTQFDNTTGKLQNLVLWARTAAARASTNREVWDIYHQIAKVDDRIEAGKKAGRLPSSMPLCYTFCAASIERADERTRRAEADLKACAKDGKRPLKGLAKFRCEKAEQKLKESNPMVKQVPFKAYPALMQRQIAAGYALTHA